MENRIVTCNTKRFDGDDATETKLTLDFSNVTMEDIVDYAVDALIVKWQASARRAAMKKDNAVAIPGEATYVVPKPGTRATGEVSEERAMKFLLKKYGSAEKAMAALMEKMG